jgi:hypothetical protein
VLVARQILPFGACEVIKRVLEHSACRYGLGSHIRLLVKVDAVVEDSVELGAYVVAGRQVGVLRLVQQFYGQQDGLSAAPEPAAVLLDGFLDSHSLQLQALIVQASLVRPPSWLASSRS